MTSTSKPSDFPPLPNFTGDSRNECEVESFPEWLEQFEMMAEAACQWSQCTRLVNISMRLRGSAYSFYQSCSPDQRKTYDELVTTLSQRFSPIRISAIKSNLFHERKQGAHEVVDT